MAENTIKTVDTGLANVPVCTSDISFTTVGKDGKPILMYRGYSIYDLVKGCFEESIYLILNNQFFFSSYRKLIYPWFINFKRIYMKNYIT